MELSPSRSRVLLLAVPAVILAAVLIATASRPLPVASVPSASPTLSTEVASGPSPTPFATRFPPFVPTPPPCIVPPTLPEVAPPVAAPLVVADGVAMLFASHLYGRRAGGSLFVRDNPDGSWEMGLWFLPAGAGEPRLLAAPEGGMVLPLALAPDGNVAAIWWLSSRRTLGEPSCDGGIYLVSTTTGESRLVIRADWTSEQSGDPGVDDVVGLSWTDPESRAGAARTYALPEARLSADGRYLALFDEDAITIYQEGEQQPRYRHAGSCTDWTWSPVGAVFVAGCESMTSAWVVDAGADSSSESIALPWFATEGANSGWGQQRADAMGMTRDGRLRLAAFYGYATGCSEPGEPCNIPPPSFAMVTVDLGSREAMIRSGRVDFLVDETVEFAADASWVYLDQYPDAARTLHAATGDVAPARRLREIVGSAADGSLLFGRRFDRQTGQVTVSSLDATGTSRKVATIGWADGAAVGESSNFLSATAGLIVGAPSE